MKTYYVIHQSVQPKDTKVERFEKFSDAQSHFESMFARDIYYAEHRFVFKKKQRNYRIHSGNQLIKARIIKAS